MTWTPWSFSSMSHSRSAMLPAIHQLRKNTQWLEYFLFIISRKYPMQYITWMNIYIMGNTLKVENGHFWVHKNMHFPKDWTLSSALQLPLQFYTCRATCQKSAISSSTNKSSFALIGAGEMFILKKWGCLLKNTLKCCNLNSPRFPGAAMSFTAQLFVFLREQRVIPTPVIITSYASSNEVPNCYYKLGKTSLEIFFPSRISPELSLLAKPPTKLGESSGLAARSWSHLNQW